MDHSSRWEIDTTQKDISNLCSRNGRRSLYREVNAGNCKRTTGTHHHTLKFGVFGRAVLALLAAGLFAFSSLPPRWICPCTGLGGGKDRLARPRFHAVPADTTNNHAASE